MDNKNLFKAKTYFWNVKPRYNINVTPEEYIEYLAQKDIIKQLCNFISTLGYTVKKINNNDFYIEKNSTPTEYEEEDNEV